MTFCGTLVANVKKIAHFYILSIFNGAIGATICFCGPRTTNPGLAGGGSSTSRSRVGRSTVERKRKVAKWEWNGKQGLKKNV